MRRLANMRRFSERNPVTIGLIGIASIAMLVIIGMAYPRIAALVTSTTYTAYFSDVGALKPGTEVQVSGYRVGTVSAIKLDGPRVRVDFTVDDGVRLGARTEAAIRTETLLGTKVLEVYIGYLRRKLGEDDAGESIETVRNVGYRLRVPRG